MKPKKELIRVVRAPDGSIFVDLTGKKSGRGAYFCRDPKCFDKALNEDRLSKALDCSIDKDTIERLKEEVIKSEAL